MFDSFLENLSVDGCAMVCEDVEEFHCLGFSYCDDQLGCWLTKSRPENVPAQQTVKQNSCYIYQRKADVQLFPINERALKTMVHFIWHVMTERLFSLPLTKVGIHFGHVRMCATPYPISWIIFILDLGPSYTDKLLEFRWVQIVHLS